jgi:cytochrome oxidase assembly protein ShyY1
VYRFLLTPRWVSLHLVVLLMIPAFVFLGRWQYGRFEERSANSGLVSGNLAAKPVPLESLTAQGVVRFADRFRSVTAAGTYDQAHALVVRRRPLEGQAGFYVLTPLVTGPGQAVLVNRGWVPAGATADTPPQVPPPPAGQVSVTGRLRPSETEESSGITNRPGLPAGQVLLIDPAEIGKALPYKLVGGFVELTGQQPAAGASPEFVPVPDVGEGGGLNLAYAVQWWLFIGIAVGGWVVLLRREAAERRADAGGDVAVARESGASTNYSG